MFKKLCYTLTMLVSLFAASANGDPWAYSINSDAPDDGDRLHYINLADGSSTARPFPLFGPGEFDPNDVEGLAFDTNRTLWGIDDGLLATFPTMFPINTSTGSGNSSAFIPFTLLQSGGHNDFGMTFTCDNSLYVTSVTTHTLYRLGLDRNVEVIGDLGTDVHISAIAAIGNPTRLYGLGNGDSDSPSLYSIDIDTGAATVIGNGLGAVGEYSEGGMAFDDAGVLWAITDRSLIDSGSGSQILRIDVNTGIATVVSSTTEIGFESLAIGPPTDCDIRVDDEYDDPRIPTLNLAGRLLAVIILMLTGMVILRRRIS